MGSSRSNRSGDKDRENENKGDSPVQSEKSFKHERLRLATKAADLGIWEWRVDSDELIWDFSGTRNQILDGMEE